jgi:hypothetical protein
MVEDEKEVRRVRVGPESVFIPCVCVRFLDIDGFLCYIRSHYSRVRF